MLNYNLTNIDFEITYNCNFRCTYCSVKPKLHDIIKEYNLSGALEILEKFIKLSINTNIKTIRVYIAGGEPTLHAQFDDVFSAFHETLEKYTDYFDEILLSVPTNFYRFPTVMLKHNHEKITKRIAAAVHTETDVSKFVKDLLLFHGVNKSIKCPIELTCLTFYSDNKIYNSKQISHYNTLREEFKDTGIIVHMNPMMYYWKNKLVKPRPDIKELKHCKPVNYVIDEDLLIYDACRGTQPGRHIDKSEIMNLEKFPDEPRTCDHLCYDDYSRVVFDKRFIRSDNEKFMYNNKLPDDLRGNGA